MRLVATIFLITLAGAAFSQTECTRDTSYSSEIYHWVLCIDHSEILYDVETSSMPSVISMKVAVMPTVALTNVTGSVQTIITDCGPAGIYVEHTMSIPNQPMLQPVHWKRMSDMSYGVQFEEVPAMSRKFR